MIGLSLLYVIFILLNSVLAQKYKISFKYNMNKKIKRYIEIIDGRKTDVNISYKHLFGKYF